MLTIATVLRSGGTYEPRHVVALNKQLRHHNPEMQLTVLSDMHVPGVPRVHLNYASWAGWWAKMELFRPDLRGDIFYMDLDSVITGSLSDLIDIGRLAILRDFYRPHGLQSAVMYLPEADRAEMWEKWITNPFQHMHKLRMEGVGDQAFLEKFWLDKAERIQDIVVDQVVSYKVHCNPKHKTGGAAMIPDNARIICGHGKPRVPWGLPEHDAVRQAAMVE